MLQQTLRYMTKLDRAINMEKELEDLSSKYKSLNISALDLFELLENVGYTTDVFASSFRP